MDGEGLTVERCLLVDIVPLLSEGMDLGYSLLLMRNVDVLSIEWPAQLVDL